MKNITMEKVLRFAGFLIRAVFLIAWNLVRVGFMLFLVLLGAGAHAEAVEEEHSDEGVRIKGVSTDMRDWMWD